MLLNKLKLMIIPAAITVALVLGSATCGVALIPRDEKTLVWAYYDYLASDAQLARLKACCSKIDVVSPTLYSFTDYNGGINTGTGPDSEMLKVAKANDIKVIPILSNYRNGGFDSALAHSVISNSTKRTAAINNIFKIMQAYNYSGINVDIEGIPPADRANFTRFIQDLSKKLQPYGYLVTIAIPAKSEDNPSEDWSGAYDYTALGKIADMIVIMAYDEHWSDSSPGPIASLPYYKEVARYTSSVIPANKVVYGLPGYGYDWQKTSYGWQGTGISFSDAEKTASAYKSSILWDNAAQVPYFAYTNSRISHQVYFENAASIKKKLDIVNENKFLGFGLWSLGKEDIGMWSSLQGQGTVSTPIVSAPTTIGTTTSTTVKATTTTTKLKITTTTKKSRRSTTVTTTAKNKYRQYHR